MHEPFKIGVAGLGTVGGGLLQLIETNGAPHERTRGKPIKIVAVSARTRSKDRRLQLADKRWVDDPVKLATGPGHRLLRRVDRRRGRHRQEGASRRRSTPRSTSSPPTRRCSPSTASNSPSSPRRTTSRSISRRPSQAAFPPSRRMREALAGNQVRRVYGILNGTCNYILTKHAGGEARRSPTCSRRRRPRATPRPIRPSTSAASIPRIS